MKAWELRQGDCIELMRALPENSIDAIVTDPPYGLGFMGKAWDALPPGLDWARECLRVLKPGGHIVAFGGQRTIHRLAVALEDAGFEIRDQIAWLQWQGFPKSLDVSKAIDRAAGADREVVGSRRVSVDRTITGLRNGSAAQKVAELRGDAMYDAPITAPATEDAKRWSGWGTALKPAYEPAILVRKPLEGTVAANVLKWGTGALNIDGCRYGYGDEAWPGPSGDITGDNDRANGKPRVDGDKCGAANPHINHASALGRWPANVYATPKASRSEREAGCEGLAPKKREDVTGCEEGSAGQQHARSGMTRTGDIRNHHPTVKPVKLMRWLCVLVGCRPGSLILDPFAGSGTTGIAALRAGFRFLGMEREPEYVEISRARIRGDSPLFNQERPVL